jgi:hypothetical protein
VPNLQEATGPVSAGGDQGRDFESYKTYLAGSLGSGAFVAKASDDLIVGACTLNKDTLSKIAADLETICSGYLACPNRVLYFCEQDIPIAKRHRAQMACRGKYGAELAIYDGTWIANELTASDTFWLAQRFLSVSSEFSPPREFDEHYDALQTKWIIDGSLPESFGDFLAIRDGLRTSVRVDGARQDLDQWLELIRPFTQLREPRWLVQRARYEVCLAEMRGHHTLEPVIDLWRAFLAHVSHTTAAEELSNAVVLLIYGAEANGRGQAALREGELQAETARLNSILETALPSRSDGQETPSILESLAMLVPFTSIAFADETRARLMLEAWSKVVKAATSTPFYPIVRLGDMFMKLNDLLGGDPSFRELSIDVDALVAEREGLSDLAARARTRAVFDLKHGRRIAALAELHHARVGWLQDDTIDGAVLAMLLLSEVYDDVNLHFAARYYAAGALYVAINHPSDKVNRLISQAAFRLANTFYAAGEGMSYIHSLSYGLKLHKSGTRKLMSSSSVTDSPEAPSRSLRTTPARTCYCSRRHPRPIKAATVASLQTSFFGRTTSRRRKYTSGRSPVPIWTTSRTRW